MAKRHDSLQERAASLAAAADALKRAAKSHAPFSLAFLTDDARCADPEAVAKALPAGVALIFRHYAAPDRQNLAARLSKLCSVNGVLMLVGGDIALAEHISAGGVHLRACDVVTGVRPPAGMIVSAACHSMAELMAAKKAGADVAFLSPVFETASHPGAAALGPAQFKALAEASPLPVLALGGVDAQNAATLAGKNIVGFGAIGAFLA